MINREIYIFPHPRVYIITFGKGTPSGEPQLYKLKKIFSSIFGEEFTILVSNRASSLYATQKETKSTYTLLLAGMIEYLHIHSVLRKNMRREDFIIIFGVSSVFQIPIVLVARIRRAKVLLYYGGAPKSIRTSILLLLANKILLGNPNLSQFFGIPDCYQNKIADNCHLFVDTPLFKPLKYYGEREKVVGYVGVLTHVKGVKNFLRAIPTVLQHNQDIKFIVIGKGDLKDEVERLVEELNIDKYVTMTGWINYTKLPSFLNEMKLLVSPSYSEGLPSIIIEAMACGTPVLATPVGGIPDIIKDGDTGFIMENNDPECVAENIIRALNHPNLAEIVINAWGLVEKEFTYEATIRRYRKIVEEL
ncbi:MAG: glycosyltransferase family 4 protein [Methanothrix sp.]|jgi:glycosyltransferase involved in cell wall biosynthesis|nr:glycosyltransferase family 4 protein [Methanothrix sp.]